MVSSLFGVILDDSPFQSILSLLFPSKMINLSQPDTIDERVINTKKLTHFKMTVSGCFTFVLFKKKTNTVQKTPIINLQGEEAPN